MNYDTRRGYRFEASILIMVPHAGTMHTMATL